MKFLISDLNDPGSILGSLHLARERTVRNPALPGRDRRLRADAQEKHPGHHSQPRRVHTIEEINPGALSQAELHVLIDELQLDLAGIDGAVRETYFA